MYLVFSDNCEHILTGGEMNASCWLAENYIIIRDKIDKIQQMANTANAATSEQDGDTDRNLWLAKIGHY
jgi:hypothetical protein